MFLTEPPLTSSLSRHQHADALKRSLCTVCLSMSDISSRLHFLWHLRRETVRHGAQTEHHAGRPTSPKAVVSPELQHCGVSCFTHSPLRWDCSAQEPFSTCCIMMDKGATRANYPRSVKWEGHMSYQDSMQNSICSRRLSHKTMLRSERAIIMTAYSPLVSASMLYIAFKMHLDDRILHC